MKPAISVSSRNGFPSPLAFHLRSAIFALQTEASAQSDALPFDKIAAAATKMGVILNGLQEWQAHPAKRAMIEPPVIWRSGSSRLIDYGQTPEATKPDGPAILVLPSLVNKPYILDLSHKSSFLRSLARAGLRPLLLDWGSPEASEQNLGINDYILKRALPALEYIRVQQNQPVGLLGYCMGGTIGAAIAQIAPSITALATIGAPWDFSEMSRNQRMLQAIATQNNSADLMNYLALLGDTFGAIPFEFMQYLFATINPDQFATKFEKFARMRKSSAEARHFVAIEDWLADGVAISRPVVVDLLINWHVKNQISCQKWAINGHIISAAKIEIPSLIACGKSDTIAPLASTMPLFRQISNARLLQADTGHIGMIVGSNAQNKIIEPICRFFLEQAEKTQN